MSKQALGQFYTIKNPFKYEAFKRWASEAGLPDKTILEPFAGSNSLIMHLTKMGLCKRHASFDISPSNKRIKKQNTLYHFPHGYDVCVTNPPWLAHFSAKRLGIQFPFSPFNDLYKLSIYLCLDNCKYVAALLPLSFIKANIFQERLTDVITINKRLFKDTLNPVCLALFGPEQTQSVNMHSDNKFVGTLDELKSKGPKLNNHKNHIHFNRPDGNLGLITTDDTKDGRIRFYKPEAITDNYTVKKSSRYATVIQVDSGEPNIAKLNSALNAYREETQDMLLLPFRCLREDGKYRRQIGWTLTKKFICESMYKHI